jgi:hypothetical protein
MILVDRTSVFGDAASRAGFAGGALRWLLANLHFFDPPQEDTVAAGLAGDNDGNRRRKAFAELGALLRLATRAPAFHDDESVRRLTAWWLATVRARNFFFDARRRDGHYALRCVAYAVMRSLGEAPAATGRALQDVLERGRFERLERSAWEKIDTAYYLDAAGLSHRLGDRRELARASSLAAPPSLPYTTNHDLYGITHLLFHLADFGRVDVSGVLGAALPALRDYVELALAMCIAESDWDLAAEFLICRICLHAHGAIDLEAGSALREAQTSSGFIPDRAWLCGLAFPDDVRGRAEMEFFAVYHPTIVALFAVVCDMTSEDRRSAE